MLSIVLVTPEPHHFLELTKHLKSNPQVQISRVETRAEAVQIASTQTPALMIIDVQIENVPGLQVVRDLIMVNAGIHIAVVSEMPEAEFAAASEGLGILAQLKPNPGKSEACMLISTLEKLYRGNPLMS